MLSIALGPVAWAIFFWTNRALPMAPGRYPRTGWIALGLLACSAVLLVVLTRWAASDVISAPWWVVAYLFMGLAWLQCASLGFQLMGLSLRYDAIERGNPAASAAAIGALLGVTASYAGANIGDGPGWWVVVFCAALATATLFLAWFVIANISSIGDAIAIDRNVAAGVRHGIFLISVGLILGRGAAGDWTTMEAAIADFAATVPFALRIVAVAMVVEWVVARVRTPRGATWASIAAAAPASLYLLIALSSLRTLGWPE